MIAFPYVPDEVAEVLFRLSLAQLFFDVCKFLLCFLELFCKKVALGRFVLLVGWCCVFALNDFLLGDGGNLRRRGLR